MEKINDEVFTKCMLLERILHLMAKKRFAEVEIRLSKHFITNI